MLWLPMYILMSQQSTQVAVVSMQKPVSGIAVRFTKEVMVKLIDGGTFMRFS